MEADTVNDTAQQLAEKVRIPLLVSFQPIVPALSALAELARRVEEVEKLLASLTAECVFTTRTTGGYDDTSVGFCLHHGYPHTMPALHPEKP